VQEAAEASAAKGDASSAEAGSNLTRKFTRTVAHTTGRHDTLYEYRL
jgi:hypothetical protein